MNFVPWSVIGCLLVVNVSLGAPIADPVISTFNTNLEGWSNPDIRFVNLIGNPPGALEFQELYSANAGFASAPSKFLGDWSLLDGTGSIAYDHRVPQAGIPAGFWGTSVPREIRLTGPGGSATWIGSLPVFSNAWTNITAPLDAANWTVTSGTWSGLLSNVTLFQLRVDHFNDFFGAERTQFDNITLSATPATGLEPIPEPSTFVLLATGCLILSLHFRRSPRPRSCFRERRT